MDHWNTKIGRGVIDCKIFENQELIVAGDVTSFVVLLDFDGQIKGRAETSMPVWSVDSVKPTELIVAAGADKSGWRGAISIINDLQSVEEYEIGSPVWDVCISENGKLICASTWGDGLVLVEDKTLTQYPVSNDVNCYGVCRAISGAPCFYIVANNSGIYKLDENKKLTQIAEVKNACYRIANDNDKYLYFGSNNGFLNILDIESGKIEKIYLATSEICSVSFDDSHIYCGDLSGNLFSVEKHENTINHSILENAGIWSISIHSDNTLIIASGDGSISSIDKTIQRVKRDTKKELLESLDHLKNAKVFVSYSSEDAEQAINLNKALKQFGIDSWIDRDNLLPGQNWKFEIENAINNCDFLILCLSETLTKKRGYIQKEIKYALDVFDMVPKNEIFLIPVRLEECEVPEFISEVQWVDLFSEDGLLKILKAIHIGMSKKKH